MRYQLLACDYDETLATQGIVAPKVWDALKQVKRSGRKIVLVTGRQLGDLLALLPEAGIFDRIVAENGAVLYQPQTQQERLLAAPPPPEFMPALFERGVQGVVHGRVIVASHTPFEKTIVEVI